jgi:class 3 adenylate cyclase
MIETGKHRTISERLSEAARISFVGRENELDLLFSAIRSANLPFVVAFIHGPGGIGKSCLIQTLIGSVAPEVHSNVMDCRNIEPTPQGFLFSLATDLGMPEGSDHQSIVNHLGQSGQRTVIALDTYETFGLMDTWLRQVFVPSLTENVFTIIAGRLPPSTGWLTTPGWQELFRDIELKELTEANSRKMMESRGLNPKHFETVQRFARGYPLVLEMAATALHAQPDLEIKDGPPPKILQQLTQAFLSGIDPEVVEAVEAASTVRCVTEPLLRGLLHVPDVKGVFKNLQSLPFIDVTTEGLTFHDVVHDTIAKELSWRDAERYRTYRRRAWNCYVKESQHAVAHGLWRLTANMLYLAEHPVVREAFFPAGGTDYIVEPATDADGNHIYDIASINEGEEAANLIKKWWDRYPNTFSVAKSRDEKIAGFYSIFDPNDIQHEHLMEDPLTAAWLNHLIENPVSDDERVLFLRRWLARTTGEAPSPVQGACWLDIKRAYMALRPSLRRLYTTVIDLDTYGPIVTPLGFAPIEGAHVSVGKSTYYTAALDFGPSSVDGWIASVVGAELGIESTENEKTAEQRDRLLLTILFTDIVGSTERAANLGDQLWQELLERHHLIIREELTRFSGVEIDNAGDGFFAAFDRPAKGILCACAINDSLRQLKLDIRAGLHLGECEKAGENVCGIGVHIGARVAALAKPGEVLVSGTIKEAVAGSNIKFEDFGTHELKGIPGEWHLFRIDRESVASEV